MSAKILPASFTTCFKYFKVFILFIIEADITTTIFYISSRKKQIPWYDRRTLIYEDNLVS